MGDEVEWGEVANSLGLDGSKASVRSDVKQGVTSAALAEYLGFLHGAQPGSLRELREVRLAHLIRDVWKRTPSEIDVASTFGLTLSEARALIRSTRLRRAELLGTTSTAGEAERMIRLANMESPEHVTLRGSSDAAGYLNAVLLKNTAVQSRPLRRETGFQTVWFTDRLAVDELAAQFGLRRLSPVQPPRSRPPRRFRRRASRCAPAANRSQRFCANVPRRPNPPRRGRPILTGPSRRRLNETR